MKLSSFVDVAHLTLTVAVITVDLPLPPLPLAGRILTGSSISSPNSGTLAIILAHTSSISDNETNIGQRQRKN